ncbi:hypothetical protein [Streptomyces liangshanensis]|uniref:Uncharacterized protein n=1 Tax=Streptomyces liangshanensis TaxID=2717324 RepID=A0A6G9H4X5_9ACTN|nr:hypothetical protein [Streptomyces liangshanensis]QIQ05575.1 hypothetical protein HA039_27705 [Streptomyces liangshanensis]
MSSRIEIVGGPLSPADLKDALASHIDDAGVRLDVDGRTSLYRGGSGTELLVAYVGGGATALSALITGVFALLAMRQGQGQESAADTDGAKIVLHGADGSSVECPANATREELVQLVELARKLGSSTIELP